MNSASTPDDVCSAFAESGAKITVRAMDEETILLEGSAEALEQLGALLIAQARGSVVCGFHVSPRGAGSAIFSSGSDRGLYFHKLPCNAEPAHDAS
jgi:hypothetical protein